jgi:hypothetical protein
MEKITRDEVVLYLQTIGMEGYEDKIKNDKYYNVIKQQIFNLINSVRISKLKQFKDMDASEIYKSTTGAARFGL